MWNSSISFPEKLIYLKVELKVNLKTDMKYNFIDRVHIFLKRFWQLKLQCYLRFAIIFIYILCH